jgi:methyl-accepting chemotaxis protein WspA
MSLRLRIVAFTLGIVALAVCATVAAHLVAHRTDLSTLAPAELRRLLGIALAALATIAIPAALAADWFARSFTAEADAVAEAIGTQAADEIAACTARVRDIVSRLEQVDAAAQAASREQLRSARDLGTTAQQLSGRITDLAGAGDRLMTATEAVQGIAREAAAVADRGRGGLEGMARSMEHLDEAMNAFTRKLATISQRAAGITAVVTTIAKVAEQTNLLSVNATIEAEKAGESGRGFRIVAQEIRRLADQTAMATKDIERMVRDMQGAVAGGTMEMDRFRNDVSGRIGEVAAVSEQLGRIIEPVHSVTRSLDELHDGMTAQAAASRRIRESVDGLLADAAQATAAVAAASGPVDDLRRLVGELTAEPTSLPTA